MTVNAETDTTNADAPDVSGCALTEAQQRLLALVSESWKQVGGPVQYLQARYQEPNQKKFGDAMLEKFSEDAKVTYTQAGLMPTPENVTYTQAGPILHPRSSSATMHPRPGTFGPTHMHRKKG